MKRTGDKIELTEPNEVFCFGSNLVGKHGGGAARFAYDNYGAIYGQGIGLQGRSYAIPTKDANIFTLTLQLIELYVDEFLRFARHNPYLQFVVTPIGCGLAGYKPSDIAPMFNVVPDNVILPEEFNNNGKITLEND